MPTSNGARYNRGMDYRKLRIALIAISGLILVAACTVFAYANSRYDGMALVLAAYICGFPALIVFMYTLGIHAAIEWPWRFNVRTLLIVLTLIAIALGIFAWVAI